MHFYAPGFYVFGFAYLCGCGLWFSRRDFKPAGTATDDPPFFCLYIYFLFFSFFSFPSLFFIIQEKKGITVPLWQKII